jgi:hypothetical protein
VFALFLLGIVCFCGVELAAIRIRDPALYRTVTAPAREAVQEANAQFSAYIEQRRAERELRRQQELKRQEEIAFRREMQRQRELAATELAFQMASRPVIEEELPPADPTITEFLSEDERELLTGGSVDLVYFNQGDEAWAEELFGRDPIGSFGCGPTALAMIAATMADESATPASVALWASRAGYCAPGSGSYLSIVEGFAEHYGLDYAPLGALDADSLRERVSEGIVVALMGPGHFTGGGHFILLHGVTLDGGILVADPNSRDNSLTVWDAQTIVDELSRSRHDGAPLWLVTAPPAL